MVENSELKTKADSYNNEIKKYWKMDLVLKPPN